MIKLVMKALLYRVLATVVTIGVSLLITKNFKISVGIGLLEFSIKTFAYLIYDLFWRKYADNSTAKKR